MFQLLLKTLLMIASAGFGATVVVHLRSLVGLPPALGALSSWLVIGVFAVHIPACLLVRSRSDSKSVETASDAMRDCPRPMRWAFHALFVYAFANSFCWILSVPEGASALPSRFLSGYGMLFYFGAMGVLYSSLKKGTGSHFTSHPRRPSPTHPRTPLRAGHPAR